MTEVLMWHSKKPRRLRLRGFSIPFWVGGLIPRLATSYSSPSNHLQMQQATTLAKTERKNDRSSLMRFTPFLYLSGGGSVVHYITGAEMPQEAISPCLLSKPQEKSVKGGHRPQRLPLILFFVGYNAGGENGCPSVSLLPPVLHCPFRRKKVKGGLRPFFICCTR